MATKQEQRFGVHFVWFWGHHFQTNPKIGVIYYDRRVVNGVIDCKWVYEWGYMNFVVDEMVNIYEYIRTNQIYALAVLPTSTCSLLGFLR
jgi:hypothetical protein